MINKDKFEKYFLQYRRYLNVSATELGNDIGVTRQQINNVEHGRSKMSTTMYLALMFVLSSYYGEEGKRIYLDDLDDDEIAFYTNFKRA